MKLVSSGERKTTRCLSISSLSVRDLASKTGKQEKRDRPGFSSMWKTRPQPRIKPVIARDTTCSVSLLTGTICGSNFAIPRTKILTHGNGKEFKQYAQSASPAVRRPARGDSAPSASKRLRRLGFQVRWPGARNLKRNQVTLQAVRKPNPGSRKTTNAVAVPRPLPRGAPTESASRNHL